MLEKNLRYVEKILNLNIGIIFIRIISNMHYFLI